MEHSDIHRFSSPESKVALFRSLFRGRDDVYARRFENHRTGKSGYSPACANEWAKGICEKPRIKCIACPHQRFLPVTDDAIRWHLSGRDNVGHDFTMGVYPLLRDETCYFLAVDMDKEHWRADTRALVETCRRFDLPTTVERSRSGNGGHLWFFFEEAIPAQLARKLGAFLLTETMDSRPGIGLDSYDRFFPNQDTLPQGGFGNLIALPLQKSPRELGNSVFLNDDFEPHPDQWAWLSSICRIKRENIETLVMHAERQGRIIGVRLFPTEDHAAQPWLATPSRHDVKYPVAGLLPKQIELVVGNQIYLAKDQLSPSLQNHLIRIAAFQNPEFYKAQAMRLPTYTTPRIIGCAEDFPKHLGLPRGCLDDVQALFSDLKLPVILRDERFLGQLLEVEFHGRLHPEQELAAHGNRI